MHITNTVIDSMYIIPSSVIIQASPEYKITSEISQRRIILHTESSDSIRVTIRYQVLSKSPDLTLAAIDTAQLHLSQEELPMSYKFPKTDTRYKKNPEKGVAYTGAFGRGLSFGNNQNVVLNSNLNLQLEGKLGDDIEISAAIADDNLPIQADGNTQQLNEIDKVYIELKRKNQILLAGDQQLKPDDTYFLRYLKKYKGMQFISKDQVRPGATLETKISGAIARGNFKRQTILVQEGNQGPYRLTGSNNELFIIILSASERVYLDGEILLRGLEHDYVIDYNRSELSFTAKRILNRNSRIVIEFEYSNQSYLKSAWGLQSKYRTKDLTLQWNTYNEQDNKSSNILQSLTAEDKQILNLAGDQFANLERSTVQAANVTSVQNNIFYHQKDTVVNGQLYQDILELDRLKASDIYTAQFTFVGQGNGNYIVEREFYTNGRSYRWVAPDIQSNNKLGEYEPVIRLTAPKRQIQHAFRMEYKPSNGFYSNTEISVSNTDLNLYSSKDHQDNNGLAIKQVLSYLHKPNVNTNWLNEVHIERLSSHFNVFDPFRNPEFNRDWGIISTSNIANPTSTEVLWGARSHLQHANYEVGYKIQGYKKGSQYYGLHQSWNTSSIFKQTSLKFNGSNLKNEYGDYQGTFFRPKIELQQDLGKTKNHHIGISMDKESNRLKNQFDQALLRESFSFFTFKTFLHGQLQGNKMNYNIEYRNRTDQKINGNHFDKHYQANDVNIEHQWQVNNKTTWSARIAHRSLRFSQINDIKEDQNNRTLLFRQSLSTRSTKNHLRYDQTFETGTGQEPALEYTYLKVNKGQGYYTWIDINKDSILQVTEFEIAPFTDQGEYIRYAVTGNEFIKTKNYLFLQNFEIDGQAIKRDASSVKWYHKLGWVSNWNYSWKVADGQSTFLPLKLTDVALTSIQGQMRNQLYLNRGHSTFELQIGQLSSISKWRLSTGFETRNQNELFIRERHKLNKKMTAECYIATLEQSNQAEFFKEKNYILRHYVFEPKINFQPNTLMRLSGAYRYKNSRDDLSDLTARLNEVRMETTAQPWPKWNVRSTLSSIWINLQGTSNPWREYSLLQGLRDGQNLLLQINIDREINTNTILRLGYHGRKSEGSRFIQTGQAQVIASF